MNDKPTDADDPKLLHAVLGPAGWHLVTAAVIAHAQAVQDSADATSCTDFGELRRSNDIDELADRLDRGFGLSIDEYAAAIERFASRIPSGTIAERLTSLADVDFPGDDDANAPADSEDFRSEHERDNEVVDHYQHTIEQGMATSVPADVLDAFDARYNPMFSDGEFAMVEAERLEEMVAMLEARGYTIIRP